MNYFELFEIKPTFLIDKKQLADKYFLLQKKYHPDYYGQASEQEQEDAMELSTAVNNAYKVLKNKDETIKYVLTLLGAIQPDEKYQLDNMFLMEVLELNELKMEGAEPEEITNKAQEILNNMQQEVNPVLQNFNFQTNDNQQLASIKAYYYQKKYVDRLLRG